MRVGDAEAGVSASSDSNRPGGNASDGAEHGVEQFTPPPTALAHLELILNGAYPLAGFMTAEESASVVKHGRLPDGTPWPVPVTLPVPDEFAGAERVVLTDPEGAPLAELTVSESWWDQGARTSTATAVSSAADEHESGYGLRLAGEIRICRPPMHGALRTMRLAPSEVSAQREIGAHADRPLLAVVTNRPLHHGTLYQIRAAAEEIGDSGRGEVLVLMDVPFDSQGMAPVIMAAESLLPSRTRFVALTLPPADTEAGADGDTIADDAPPPGRDELLAAHVARAYAATHVFVPRPAGHPEPEVDDAPIPIMRPQQWRYDAEEQTWGPADRVAIERAEPEPDDDQVEEMLALGQELPAWFTPPHVAAELARLRPPRTQRGVAVFLTGLSGSGKSTVARGVAEGIRRYGRSVTLLDGDVVRRLLSAGLTFSKADRDLNIRRIGYVAAEIARHGGVAICAPIAPYAATRARVRAMVEEAGDFFLVHVATPLRVCEARDRKGLYAKARTGEIPEFTGISDPYEEPTDADLTLDTAGTAEDESVAEVLAALRSGGWLPAERY